MVIARLYPKDARRLGRAKAHREHGSERNRPLAEDVARVTFADHALDPVDRLDRLDPTLEHCEERRFGALGRGVLACSEPDVRRRPRQALARSRVERSEQRDASDLLRGHHGLLTT